MPDRPRIGVALIITRGDEVLLMRRNGSHGAGTWSTPGGHLDFGESLEECARREAREETGLEVAAVTFRAITNDVFDHERRHYVTVWMEGAYAGGAAAVRAPEEMTEVGWFRWGALPEPLFLPFRNLLAGASYPSGSAG
jgi:8-oxo-dGTP diphosphatase